MTVIRAGDGVAMEFDAFVAALGETLELRFDGWDGAARLVADVGLDSLDFYEVLCTVEEWTGVEFADELILTWETFDDLYRCYVNNMDPIE